VVAGDPYAEEAIYQVFLSRLADLSEETALCFGRIDRVDGMRCPAFGLVAHVDPTS
jgi:hypothetical protein